MQQLILERWQAEMKHYAMEATQAILLCLQRHQVVQVHLRINGTPKLALWPVL
jgi:hypothetical protein